MKKSILVTTQGVNGGTISPAKPAGFVSLNFDSSKLTIDAYCDMFRDATPREKCLMILADEKEVFEFTTETLFEMARFFAEFSQNKDKVERYRNKHHFIVTDASERG